MALNIKDAETERLATELAGRLNMTKTAAIRIALRAQLAGVQANDRQRFDDALEVLRSEIWPLTADSAPIAKADREAILGYPAQGSNE